ncbi:two-component sensor histidine kinase [Haemophilus quentini]|uniref:envelope stress sensor histidine kinase CpxA n=1 Tax=Haemophilus TaxID=724 RepID=UPI00021B2C4F|nr:MULTISPECIES: envelope stress sensor histidine kinase CpxA [Haemophilus]EGT83079.1 two-component sensor histidine kinase CpxA [Haemophilus haemolyticus M21639]NYA47611.1 envelope stress sensor histidine kinase CpxA [Haemophilus haemolyticus]ORC37690.1 two-component sensor histidine kinase [Haemophilus quentini]
MKLRSFFCLNQLAIRTFAMFWFSFFIMMSLVIVLPNLDLRLYSPLEEADIVNYQKKILNIVRNGQLQGLISEVPDLPSDKFQPSRPVLINLQTKDILGELPEETTYIRRFTEASNNFSEPKRKNFNEVQISGPFQVYLGDGANSYALYFISYVNPQREIFNYVFDRPIILILLILLITSPLLWWFTRMLTKPISRLQEAANSVALGNFKIDKSLVANGPLELRQVGQSFNRMAASIDHLISNQQTLLSSISHELKTPLTRLQLTTALVRHECGETDSVKRIEREIGRMDKMISELLLLSRQQMNSQMERDIFYANTLWTDIINDAKFEAEQRGIAFLTNIRLPKNELQLNGNFRLLESAIENIVTNALKYTKDKIELHIFIQEEEEEEEEFLRIRIDDNGSGVHPDEFEKIFKPFYRVDETRTRTTGGTGLGLAIVSNVIQEHQGKVWAEKSPLGGLTVTIRLPLWLSK